jgi:DNA-binding transcriptional LysR family regulator
MSQSPIDLNLLLIFQAIYETGGVTEAGARLHMSQSAVSNALKRLRMHLNDPVFVRSPQGMMPTTLAIKLIGPVQQSLSGLSLALEQTKDFDPLSANVHFKIAMNDVAQLTLMPGLVAAAGKRCPGVTFETIEVSPDNCRQLLGDRKIDLAMGTWELQGAGVYQQKLFEEGHAVLLRVEHPLKAEQLDLDAYLCAEHIAYRPSGTSYDSFQIALARVDAAMRRKVVISTAHCLGLSSIVANSDFLFSGPRRLLKAMATNRPDLRVASLPFEVPPISIKQFWHERQHADPSHVWLRRLVFELFSDFSAPFDFR